MTEGPSDPQQSDAVLVGSAWGRTGWTVWPATHSAGWPRRARPPSGGRSTGAGAGTFATSGSYASGGGPDEIAIGDFNNDGRPDVATVNTPSSTVSVFLNDGAGGLQAAQNSAAGSSPDSLGVADFNGDGTQDIALGGNSGGSSFQQIGVVSLLLGEGDGTFDAPMSSPLAGHVVEGITTGDVNGDGTADVIAATFSLPPAGTVTVFPGNGDGTLATPVQSAAGSGPSDVFVADLDGQGALDIAVSDTSQRAVLVMSGLGNGTFSLVESHALPYDAQAVVAADLNGDGLNDLAVNNEGGTVSVLLHSTGP